MIKKKDEGVQISYEQALLKLEESVRLLEKGELSLEDSLKAFEDGIKWSRLCEERLSEAKGQVEMLIKKASGEVGTKSFEIETGNE